MHSFISHSHYRALVIIPIQTSTPLSGSVLVEADGEIVGTWPVAIEIIPDALPLIV